MLLNLSCFGKFYCEMIEIGSVAQNIALTLAQNFVLEMSQTVHKTEDWLPTSVKEMRLRGWDEVDVVLFSGDAYVDHPSFGAAVIGRILEREGLRVAIVPQPNWRDDLRDFKKLGAPRLFFAITSGCMDSMVNHYTANRRKRSNDAYTAEGRAGQRPDYATVVYSKILKDLYPEVPVVVGGIEASLRRLTHYDYWSDKLMPGILIDSKADLLFYGMGEKSIIEYVRFLQRGIPSASLTNIPQTAFVADTGSTYSTNKRWETISLASHEVCLVDKKAFAGNFKHIEKESNRINSAKLTQQVGERTIVVNPAWPPLTTKEVDDFSDLPFTRLPHPRYQNKGAIPAYEMIRHSVNIHRGCFGGCSFCTISAHQGKFIASRSEESILKEVEEITMMPDFKGSISDLGGPAANMYKMGGTDKSNCERCVRPSCIYPTVCKTLNINHQPMTELYRKVKKMDGVKNAFVSSGIRYDMVFHKTGNRKIDAANLDYLREVIRHHVSGRLKVAPEHASDKVLSVMRKPNFGLFRELTRFFDEENKKAGKNQQLIPYFISSHPGSQPEDMAELAAETKDLNFRLEQVQDFTPTPMTVATVIYYSGYHPYTLEPVAVARSRDEKLAQRQFFFWYQRENQKSIRKELQKMHRPDLETRLFGDEAGRRSEQPGRHEEKQRPKSDFRKRKPRRKKR